MVTTTFKNVRLGQFELSWFGKIVADACIFVNYSPQIKLTVVTLANMCKLIKVEFEMATLDQTVKSKMATTDPEITWNSTVLMKYTKIQQVNLGIHQCMWIQWSILQNILHTTYGHTTYRMSDYIVSFWTKFRRDKNYTNVTFFNLQGTPYHSNSIKITNKTKFD